RQTEQLLDSCPFTDIVSFHFMARILKDVTQDDSRHSVVPREKKQQHNPGNRAGNTQQMDIKVERVLMPLEPVSQGATGEIQDGTPALTDRILRICCHQVSPITCVLRF